MAATLSGASLSTILCLLYDLFLLAGYNPALFWIAARTRGNVLKNKDKLQKKRFSLADRISSLQLPLLVQTQMRLVYGQILAVVDALPPRQEPSYANSVIDFPIYLV